MIIYAETNFLLELALNQEESSSCEALVRLSEQQRSELALPAYSFVEPFETLRRRHSERMRVAQQARKHARILGRSEHFSESAAALNTVERLFRESTEVEEVAFQRVQRRLIACATVLPLSPEVLQSAATARLEHGFGGQDSVVLASIVHDLQSRRADSSACFITRNPKDFDNPSIVEALQALGCRMLFSFKAGEGLVGNALRSGSA